MGDKESYESFYNGGISSFDRNYGGGAGQNEFSIGYTKPAGSSYLGFPGSPQTANQLGETINAIKQGVKSFEISLLSAQGQGEQIPKQHFDEMRALMKLTGVKPSVHGPIDLDPSGMGQQGFSENEREENERRFFFAMQQAAKLKDEGNINVVFHSSSGMPAGDIVPGDVSKGEERFRQKSLLLVDRDTGQIKNQIKEDKQFYWSDPEKLKEGGSSRSLRTKEDREKEIEVVNSSNWDNQISSLNVYKKEADEVERRLIENPLISKMQSIKTEEQAKKFNEELAKDRNLQEQKQDLDITTQRFSSFLHNNRLAFQGAFDNAYRYGTEKQKEELYKLAKDMKKIAEEGEKTGNPLSAQLAYSQMLDRGIGKLIEITTPRKKDEKDYVAPKQFMPVEEFTRENAAKTFGNIAWRGYKELGGEKAPVVSVENMFAGEWAHSTAEGMEELIKASRKKFVENAVANKMDKKRAEKMAEKLIGVTWDVGHLNMMKKSGFTDEDVVAATKKIAPYVKHVHLTDNFGYSDSHLAPGMGNVPIKKILEELEKTGRLGEMSKIVESGAFVQNFKKSPHGLTLAALGSPIYGAKMGPTWNQVSAMSLPGGYFASPMAYLPEKHFSTYGSGFSSLPTEVGGQIPGTASRFSGTSNA